MACASCAAAAAESSYPFSLGTYSLQAAGSNAAVAQDRQLWLDRAMAWTFGFHRDDGIACFERVLELDPGCALAHWGIAFCHGPNCEPLRSPRAHSLLLIWPILIESLLRRRPRANRLGPC
jgi:hypothetical protein